MPRRLTFEVSFDFSNYIVTLMLRFLDRNRLVSQEWMTTFLPSTQSFFQTY